MVCCGSEQEGGGGGEDTVGDAVCPHLVIRVMIIKGVKISNINLLGHPLLTGNSPRNTGRRGPCRGGPGGRSGWSGRSSLPARSLSPTVGSGTATDLGDH